jgi:hypothetical protein
MDENSTHKQNRNKNKSVEKTHKHSIDGQTKRLLKHNSFPKCKMQSKEFRKSLK